MDEQWGLEQWGAGHPGAAERESMSSRALRGLSLQCGEACGGWDCRAGRRKAMFKPHAACEQRALCCAARFAGCAMAPSSIWSRTGTRRAWPWRSEALRALWSAAGASRQARRQPAAQGVARLRGKAGWMRLRGWKHRPRCEEGWRRGAFGRPPRRLNSTGISAGKAWHGKHATRRHWNDTATPSAPGVPGCVRGTQACSSVVVCSGGSAHEPGGRGCGPSRPRLPGRAFGYIAKAGTLPAAFCRAAPSRLVGNQLGGQPSASSSPFFCCFIACGPLCSDRAQRPARVAAASALRPAGGVTHAEGHTPAAAPSLPGDLHGARRLVRRMAAVHAP